MYVFQLTIKQKIGITGSFSACQSWSGSC